MNPNFKPRAEITISRHIPYGTFPVYLMKMNDTVSIEKKRNYSFCIDCDTALEEYTCLLKLFREIVREGIENELIRLDTDFSFHGNVSVLLGTIMQTNKVVPIEKPEEEKGKKKRPIGSSLR